VKWAGDFEAGMNTINTVALKSPAILKAAGDGIRQIARDTGQSIDDLQQGEYDLVSAGIALESSQAGLTQATGCRSAPSAERRGRRRPDDRDQQLQPQGQGRHGHDRDVGEGLRRARAGRRRRQDDAVGDRRGLRPGRAGRGAGRRSARTRSPRRSAS
jgi:hypothetical protein